MKNNPLLKEEALQLIKIESYKLKDEVLALTETHTQLICEQLKDSEFNISGKTISKDVIVQLFLLNELVKRIAELTK